MSAHQPFQSRRFEILRELGAGGMGVVYDAVDRETGERVAIKTVQHLDPSSLLRFKREFRSLADVSHPNLVRLGELYEEDGRWFFTMELVHGVDIVEYASGEPSLTTRVTQRRSSSRDESAVTAEAPLEPSDVPIEVDYGTAEGSATWEDPVDELELEDDLEATGRSRPDSDSWGSSSGSDLLTAVAHPRTGSRRGAPARRTARKGPPDVVRLTSALEQLVGALETLHAAGQVHRDVKPSNVLVTSEGRVVLLDMGIASVVDPDRAGHAMDRVAGTAAFMAPEQVHRTAASSAADWYAVGVVLYEALTGTLPFRGPREHVLEAKQYVRPVEPRTFEPSIPELLEDLCMDLLAIDPTQRLDGQGVLARLGRLGQGAPVSDSLPPPGTSHLPFVGRSEELRSLRHRLVDVQLGATTAVLLSGEPGIGKSTLASHFLRWLRRSHPEALVLEGRCYQQEAVPFKAFDGVIDTLTLALEAMPPDDRAALLPKGVEDLAYLFPVLKRVLVRSGSRARAGLNQGEARARAFEAMRRLVQALGRRRLLVLFIEDVQWSDVESFALLQELLAPPDAPAMLVLATARADFLEAVDAGTQSPLAAGTLSSFERIVLDPLSPEEARTLASELVGPDHLGLDVSRIEQIVVDTHGHPLFLHELLRHPEVTRHGARGGVRLEDVLWQRITLLPPEPQSALRVISVAGFPLDRDMLAEMADLRRRDCAAALRTLRSEQLVRISTHGDRHAVEPYHDRIRESVEAHLDAEEKELIHARVADVMMRHKLHHEDPLALVRHLEGAGQVERAGRHALAAAERLRGGLAFELVARLYEEAVRLTSPQGDALADIHRRIADAYRRGGRARDAARWYLLGAKSGDIALRRYCKRYAAEQLILSGDIERGARELRAVLAELGVRQPPRWLMAAAIPLRERALLRRGLSSMPEESRATDSAREQLDAQAVVWRALNMVDPITTAYNLYGHAARARDLGEPSRAVESFVFALLAYTTRHGVEGRATIEPLREALRERVNLLPDATRRWVHACDSSILGMSGQPYAMTLALREVEEWYHRQEERDPMRLILLRATMLESLRTIGALGELIAYHERMLREARRTGDLMLETFVVRTTNLVWLLRDDPARAESELDRPLWTPPEAGFHIQHLYELRARCEIDMYRGATADLRRRYARGFRQAHLSMMSLLQVFALELRFLEGRVLLAEDDGTGDAPKLARRLLHLAKRIDAPGDPQRRVRAEILRAGAAAVVGDREKAADRCREIVRLADEANLALEGACARVRLGLVGSRSGERPLGEGALEWLRTEGAVRPERIVDVVMPGFRRLR